METKPKHGNNPDFDYVIDKLTALLKIPSVTGNTKEALDWLKYEFDIIGYDTHVTNKGGLIVSIPGSKRGNERLLSAHVDTLGAMVYEVKANGRLKLATIGGVAWQSIEGERVTIQTMNGDVFTGTVLTTKASSHVYGKESANLERNQENMEVRLDEKVQSKDDTFALGIRPGDFVAFDPRVELAGSGFIKSRHLDDKASCAILLGAARHFAERKLKPAYNTYLFITNYEEVGHGASYGIPDSVQEMVAVDMGCVGDGLLGSEYTVSVCAKDSSGPYDLHLRRRLERLCKDNDIPYAVDVFPLLRF